MVLEAAIKDKIDDVDVWLCSQDGQIQRPRDPIMCRHNARQKCSNCLPIDPYDEEYLKEKEIKHMSFHAHVRKLTAGHGKGTKMRKPLENTRVQVDLTCDAHKPYPKGVCTKCRPPMVTLNRQKFRHVDNISMENQDLVNNFLNYWRKSGHQRVGYLIGKYESFPEVPLGIKARVAAIYEPPQTCSEHGISFEEDKHEEAVDKLCGWLGVKRVGWIFTDLWSADPAKGTVHCIRHKDSFLLSAEECITAGHLQNKFPNVTEFSSDGQFGSKFVTIVASGDESEHIKFHGYQVSNQCAALVSGDVLCPSNYPELAYVRETPLSDAHYITDVQFTMKNEYGADVNKDGRPLPVEFLLVDVPAGMPKEPEYTFHVSQKVQFAIENRQAIAEIQGGVNFAQFCEQFSINQFLEQATNFHFLLYLMTNELVKFSEKEIIELCEIVKEQDRGRAMDWARENSNYHTLAAHSHAHEHQAAGSSGSANGAASSEWHCKHCTFANAGGSECAMCGLPA